jgi:hypothetical protein
MNNAENLHGLSLSGWINCEKKNQDSSCIIRLYLIPLHY